MADPGFPVGVGGGDGVGADHILDADVRCRRFLAKAYAKTKELGCIGGGGETLFPPMTFVSIE